MNYHGFIIWNYHLNSVFTFDYIKLLQWFGTGRLLTYYAINKNVLNKNFEKNNFLADYYLKDQKGSGYTVGSLEGRQKLDREARGFLIQAKNGILVKSNYLFYTCRKYLKKGNTFLNKCTYIKTVNLNSSAVRELNKLYPHLTLSQLDCWKVLQNKNIYWKQNDLMSPNSIFFKYGDFHFNFFEFSYEKDQKYNPWLWSNKSIYSVPTIKIPPRTLKGC